MHLHPAPVAMDRTDYNRAQLCEPSELLDMWRRAVEMLAAELQITPLEANAMLLRAARFRLS